MFRNFISRLCFLTFLAGTLVACGSPLPPAPLLTPPAINLEITENSCPSVEAQAGMQIAWTNMDDIDHTLWIERTDESGAVVEAGGTDLLQPGSTFSIVLPGPGQYTYFCSEDRSTFGTITVSP